MTLIFVILAILTKSTTTFEYLGLKYFEKIGAIKNPIMNPDIIYEYEVYEYKCC